MAVGPLLPILPTTDLTMLMLPMLMQGTSSTQYELLHVEESLSWMADCSMSLTTFVEVDDALQSFLFDVVLLIVRG